MLEFATNVLMIAGEGALTQFKGNQRLLVTLAFAAVSAGAVYAAAVARDFAGAFLAFAGGLVVAAAAGFLLSDVDAVPFSAGAYLILASAALLFVLARKPAEVIAWTALLALGVGAFLYATDAKTTSFVVTGVLILYCALKVLQAREMVHATLWLAGMLVGVAGVYLSVGAEFLASIQLLIYVGAVITLFLFTVMLTIPSEEARLEDLVLPPGVHIESVEELQEATPRMGAGPYKGFQETNPRKPVAPPATLYGVAIADGVYGDQTTTYKKTPEKKEGEKK